MSVSLEDLIYMNFNIIFAFLNIVSALIVMGISYPLVKRKVKMNYFLGIRLKESLESEKNWYTINEYGGRQMMVWSVPIITAGIACLFLPVQGRGAILLLILGTLPMIICMSSAIIKTIKFARRF